MPRPHTTMRQIRNVLRLVLRDNVSRRTTALSLSVPRTSVNDLVTRALAANITWEVVNELDDTQLEARLFHPAAEGDHASPPRLRRHEEGAREEGRHPPTALARILRAIPRWLRLQPVLPSLSHLAPTPRRHHAPGPQGRREALHRLSRSHHSHLRRAHARVCAFTPNSSSRCSVRPTTSTAKRCALKNSIHWVNAHVHAFEFLKRRESRSWCPTICAVASPKRTATSPT